jgi:hypothetical protein
MEGGENNLSGIKSSWLFTIKENTNGSDRIKLKLYWDGLEVIRAMSKEKRK